MIYIAIFISKILENALATLRLIVVSNGKKKLGAILQGMVGFIWILVTGVVIVNVNKDIFKIICFVLGSIVGSYLGSIMEEKIALGTNLIVIKSKHFKNIKRLINKYHFIIYENYLIVIVKRKQTQKLVKQIKLIDRECFIFSERIKINYDKLTT